MFAAEFRRIFLQQRAKTVSVLTDRPFEFAKAPRQKLAQIMNLIALALIAFAVMLAPSRLRR
jgi:hypothetical protein